MTSDKLFDYYVNEAETTFEGWDFSYIKSRIIYSPLPWSYRALIIPFLFDSKSFLDLDTGGGEFLSELPFPSNTFATESYEPNVKVSKNRLEPLGVTVVQTYGNSKLPFENDYFDLIINRHESFSASEVNRILKKGSILITQQVGTNDGIEINKALEAPPPKDYDPNWNLKSFTSTLVDAGFKILRSEEAKSLTRVFDIGALIYYLKAIPWQIPDFSVSKYLNNLKNLHNIIESRGYFDFTSERQLVICKKI